MRGLRVTYHNIPHMRSLLASIIDAGKQAGCRLELMIPKDWVYTERNDTQVKFCEHL